VEAVRRFSRFYTKQIGLLHEKILRSPFSLAEARVIYELAHHEKTTATELSNELGLDAGYLSRILRDFNKRVLVDKGRSEANGHKKFLRLSENGQAAFAGINARSRRDIEATLNNLSPADQARLVQAMQTIEDLLGARSEHRVPYILRPHQPGDMGWVIHRHGILYAEEYAWDEQFEALVAEIVTRFIQN
jgi:DNA-binding MarR family transcriptional regulator